MEPRFRRAQQGAPVASRNLPGMPFEMDDSDDGPPSSRKGRFGASARPWWRPAGTWGRAFLATAVILVLCVFAYGYHVCKSFLQHDARFRIAGTTNIQATGLAEVSRAEMLPVFGEDIGRNIFFVPLAERRKQLEQIPWVEHATVMRFLPDQIRVSVVERQPVAFVRHGQQVGLVDASGVLLSMPAAMMAQHHYSFPVLTGIDAGDPLPSRKARMDVYQHLLGDLDASGQHLSEQISEIDLTDPEDARVLMPEQGADILAHFGEDHFLDRYQRYKAHIAEWRQQYPKLAAVDLRYDTQVVLEITPGSSTPQTAIDAESGKPMATHPATAAVAAKSAEPAKPSPSKSKNSEIAKLPAAKSVAPAKPTASIKTPAVAKAAPPRTPAAKPVAKAQSAKSTAPKTAAAKSTTKHVAQTKHVASNTKPSSKSKDERVKAMAQKMRDRKRAEARRAALKNKQKSNAKPHASNAGQGQ